MENSIRKYLSKLLSKYSNYFYQKYLFELNRKGFLVVLEGIDGSGKTTIHNLLKEFLNNDQNYIFSSETSNNLYKRTLLKELSSNNKLSKEQRLFLFLQNRIEHLEKVVIPALSENKVVILDRYYPSTIAYQQVEGFDIDFLLEINKIISIELDLLIYFDIPLDAAIERIKERKKEVSFFETRNKLSQVLINYQKILPLFPHYKVNALNPPIQIAKKITNLIKNSIPPILSSKNFPKINIRY